MRGAALAWLRARQAAAAAVERTVLCGAGAVECAGVSGPGDAPGCGFVWLAAGDGGGVDAAADLRAGVGGRVNPIGEGFLIGVISTCSVVAGIFFLKFWRKTRDFLFLAFGVAFVVEGVNRAAVLLVARPNEGHPLIYGVRLLASLLILAAILKKNYGGARRG